MSFDTLITIGVVIYIIVSIRKALKHGKKTDGDAKPTGWRGKLKDMADQIKEEIEKANREMQQQQQRQESTSSGQMEDEDNDYWDDEPDYDDEPEDELELPEPAPVIRESVFYEPQKVKSAVGVEKPEPSHLNHPGAVASIAVPGLECKCSRSRYRRRSKKRLRQAVIWAEILDKPIGLRD